jgi:dipeptidyl aminopeptidase/acylaminoacyl peptidase
VALGQTFVTEYAARDGLAIPAYITLPPDLNSLADAKDLPFIVHPHGGPAARNFLRFDFDVQFLVSRGYGVLQMNFRGSEGYGRDFADAGHREWGQAMQDDITDGAEWLIETGIANANRMAIMGGSYGGYAALMGAVKTPTLYQCAISFAGVSDLPELLKLERRFIGGKYATRFIGDLWKDRKMLRENSPAQRADAIQVPVLLMHGDADTVVDVDQSERMAKALREAGGQVEYRVFENGDHHLSLYENRLQYLTEMERFLQECLN